MPCCVARRVAACCGSDQEPYIDRCNRVDPQQWRRGWMGQLSFATFVALRLPPWPRRRRCCARCERTVA